jgi:hypothetical protein
MDSLSLGVVPVTCDSLSLLEPTAAGRISKAERKKKGKREKRQSDLRCSDPLRIHASQLKLDPMERREAAEESGRARPVLFKAKRRITKEGGEILSIVRAKKGKAKATAEKSEETELHGPCVSHLHHSTSISISIHLLPGYAQELFLFVRVSCHTWNVD